MRSPRASGDAVSLDAVHLGAEWHDAVRAVRLDMRFIG